MAINDVYQLVQRHRDPDMKEIENVLFYRQQLDSVGGPYSTQAERLARDWILDVWPTMLPTIPSNIPLVGLSVRNLFNESDAFELPLAISGGRSVSGVEGQPSFVAAKATLAVDNGAVNKGRKQMFGMFESDQNGGLLTSGGLTNFSNRAAAYLLGVSTVLGGARAFMPVVVKRIREDHGELPPTYRLPLLLAELVFGRVVSSVLSAVVTSQNSRKD